MRTKIDPTQLKYSIRSRYFARCTELGAPVALSILYHDVSKAAGCHPSRIQRLVTCRRDSPLVATGVELDAFANYLGCKPTALATEAAERVVAQ
jgi:hypothetical protein